MENRSLSDWIIDTIILGGIAYNLVFYILKALGVINTPLWLEYSPQVIAFLSILFFGYKVIVFIEALRMLPGQFRSLRRDLAKNERDVNNIDKRLISVEQKLGN